MKIDVQSQIGSPLLLGIVQLEGISVGPASDLLHQECSSLAGQLLARAGDPPDSAAVLPESVRGAIRRMLKGGGYSPTGRNRPAHELLLNMVLEQRNFPHISAPVDVNNLLSLEAMLPISLLDSRPLGTQVTVRWGLPGESFVFNASGHVLDVKHCLVVCDNENKPLGSPIKDSMAGKVFGGCSAVLALIYGTAELHSPAQMQQLAERMAQLLQRECGGSVIQTGLAG